MASTAARSRRRGATQFVATSPIGVTLAIAVVAIALVGPLFAPSNPSDLVGIPFQPPDAHHLLGTDFLGRDALSRVLWGGRSVLVVAVLASLLAYAVGITIGLLTGYLRSALDPVIMRALDVIQAFPPIILVLLLVSGAGTSTGLLILAVALVFMPGIARLVRAATLEVSVRAYVEAATARGERLHVILFREILPNITGILLADVGIRFAGSVLLGAALSYVGLGVAPPSADWALMVSENRSGLTSNPWVVVAPAALIVMLTISANLIADGVVRRRSRAAEDES
jgi:peptide/nickel transport system permease protein